MDLEECRRAFNDSFETNKSPSLMQAHVGWLIRRVEELTSEAAPVGWVTGKRFAACQESKMRFVNDLKAAQSEIDRLSDEVAELREKTST